MNNSKQGQVRDEYANGKGNDLECLPSVNNIANGNKSTYNLRIRGEKTIDTLTRDEIGEMGEPKKNHKISILSITLVTLGLELGTPVETDERFNCS